MICFGCFAFRLKYLPSLSFVFPVDVKFIALPPSMIAAGSVAAAVQGLYLKSKDGALSSQNLTNFLSQVIRSDPVRQTQFSGPLHCTTHTCLHWLFVTNPFATIVFEVFRFIMLTLSLSPHRTA